jgi:hypothetical protein
MPFGATIPVVSLNNGFLGWVSRIGKRTITARPVLPTTPNPINFGDAVVIVPTTGGGDSYQSVADYIAGGGTFTAAKFAGICVRNVKTNLAFVSLETTESIVSVGNYAPGQMCEALEEGSITTACNVGVPLSQNPIYIRVALNGAFPAGVVGGVEAVADGANTVQVPSVLFRNGTIDGNKVVELTILNRVAA